MLYLELFISTEHVYCDTLHDIRIVPGDPEMHKKGYWCEPGTMNTAGILFHAHLPRYFIGVIMTCWQYVAAVIQHSTLIHKNLMSIIILYNLGHINSLGSNNPWYNQQLREMINYCPLNNEAQSGISDTQNSNVSTLPLF